MADDKEQPIIIKKIKKGGGGHHGGAWKVAYADFVTAMMAFFLLLWILNVSTEAAKNVISSYFDPAHQRIASATSGAGGVLGGLSVMQKGQQATSAQPLVKPSPTGHSKDGGTEKEAARDKTKEQETTGRSDGEGDGGPDSASGTVKVTAEGVVIEEVAVEQEMPTLDRTYITEREELERILMERENIRFEQAQSDISDMLLNSEELEELSESVHTEITPEGLRIQITDQEGKPLFPSGSAEMFDYTKELIAGVSDVVTTLPNDISVRGHTDSSPFSTGTTYTNWELSADRANASRRELLNNEVPDERFINVMGISDRDHFIPDDPNNPQNRRITIMLLRQPLEDAIRRGLLEELKEGGTLPDQLELDPNNLPDEFDNLNGDGKSDTRDIEVIIDKGYGKTSPEVFFP